MTKTAHRYSKCTQRQTKACEHRRENHRIYHECRTTGWTTQTFLSSSRWGQPESPLHVQCMQAPMHSDTTAWQKDIGRAGERARMGCYQIGSEQKSTTGQQQYSKYQYTIMTKAAGVTLDCRHWVGQKNNNGEQLVTWSTYKWRGPGLSCKHVSWDSWIPDWHLTLDEDGFSSKKVWTIDPLENIQSNVAYETEKWLYTMGNWETGVAIASGAHVLYE